MRKTMRYCSHTGSQNGWVWRGPLDVTCSKPLAQARPIPRAISRWLFNVSEDRLQDSMSGQTLLGLGVPHRQKLFPDVKRELPVFQLMPIASWHITGHHWKEWRSLLPFFRYLYALMISCFSLLFCKLNSPTSFSLPLYERCSSPLIIFVAF